MSVATPRPPIVAVAATPRERAVTLDRGSFARRGAHLEVAAASCRGRRHDVNEDAHSALGGRTPVFVVADGVGGGAMAARASRELVRLVHRALDDAAADAQTIRSALLVADREVARMIATHTDAAGAATVALCASVDEASTRWLVAWVGDCRVYRVKARGDGDAQALTRDDTYRHLCELPPPGGSPDDPARMIGNGAVADPNVIEATLGDGEMLVLLTDGVHRLVRARDIARLVGGGSAPLARRCTQLVALARARGSVDDATALVVHRTPGSQADEETSA
jgi:serine/threonine protein phosphatase PrpC